MRITIHPHSLRRAVAAIRRAAGRTPLLLIARDSELLIVLLGGQLSGRVTVPAASDVTPGFAVCVLATLDALAALDGLVQLQVVARDGVRQLYAFQGNACRLAVPTPEPRRTWAFDEVARSKVPAVGCSQTLARALHLARGFASAKPAAGERHVVRLVRRPDHHATIFATDNTVRFALATAALDEIGSFAVPAGVVPALIGFLRQCRVVGVYDGPGNTYLRTPDGPASLFGWERPRFSPPSPSETREPALTARISGRDLRQYVLTLRHHLYGGNSRVAVELAFGTDVLRIRSFDKTHPLGFDASVPLAGARGLPQTVWSTIETLNQVTDCTSSESTVSITNFGAASLLDFAERVAITNDGRIRNLSSAPTSATPAMIRRGARVTTGRGE